MSQSKSASAVPVKPRLARPVQRQLRHFVLFFEEVSLLLVLGAVLWAAVAPVPVATATTAGSVSGSYLLTAFIVATLLLLILIRSRLGTRIMSGLMTVALFSGVAILAWRLLGPGAAVLVTSVLLVLFMAWRRVIIHDLVIVMGIAGVTWNLGLALRPEVAAGLLAFLAIYDIVAVYVTKHMVRAAEALATVGAPFALLVPLTPAGLKVRTENATVQKGFLFLGTGDLALPALLTAAAGNDGFGAAVGAAVGALAGLALTNRLFFYQKIRKPLPALPPIAAGAIAGYLLAALVISQYV